MTYWSAEVQGSDFAFDSLGAVVFQTVERLEKEAELVIEKKYPEQSMLALLKAIEILMDEFPKVVAVTFGKKRYLAIKKQYLVWRNTCAQGDRIHLAELDENARNLFDSFELKLGID